MPSSGVDLIGVVVAGFLGAMAMWLVGRLVMLADLPSVEPSHIINAKLLGYHTDRITGLGEALHALNGILLAILYAVLVHPLPGPELLKGLAYGALLWVLLMVVVLPMLGDGLFGRKLGPVAPAISLVMHLVYGAIVAASLRYF